MIFKPYNCDFGIKYNGVNYDFDHIKDLVIEDPQTSKLVRGANASNKLGLIYTDGLKDVKKITVTILGMSAALKEVLQGAYEAQARLDVYCVDRSDGSSKIAKNSILSNEPRQLTIDDSPDSMNVALAFVSFDLTETHKS